MKLKLGLLSILVSCSAFAGVTNGNPNLTISIVSGDSFNVSGPGQEILGYFAVRLVDPKGNPIQGLTVEFFTNWSTCIPLDPNCVLPDPAIYGHFTNGGENVLTDANGVARAGTYVGGTAPGHYEVAGLVSYSASVRNADILKNGGDPDSRFTINQFAAVPVASVPTLCPLALIALVAAIALVSGVASVNNQRGAR